MMMNELPLDFTHQPPKGYEYVVTSFKKNILAIWLKHSFPYSYTTETVQTIWGFYSLQKKEYLMPIHAKKPGKSIAFSLTTPYTSMQIQYQGLEVFMK